VVLVRYEELRERVLALSPGEIFAVPRNEIPRLPSAWKRSLGFPKRGAHPVLQWRDGVVHVHVTRTHYLFHRDRYDPHRELVAHLRHDVWEVFLLALAGVRDVLRRKRR
jgi:hypothetical protein